MRPKTYFKHLATALLLFLALGLQGQTSYWYPAVNLPQARVFHAAVEWPYLQTIVIIPYNSAQVLTFGGSDGSAPSNLCWSIVGQNLIWSWSNPSTWSTIAPMPTARYGHNAVTHSDNLIYVLGGINSLGQHLGTLEVYDPVTNTWTTAAPMPTPRAHFALASDGTRLFAIGGTNGNPLSTVEIYDPATNTWSTGSPMPTARYGIEAVYNYQAVLAQPTFTIPGGATNASTATATREIYDPSTNAWTTTTPMPFPRSFYAVARDPQFSGFIAGGYTSTGNPSSEIFYWGGLSGMVPRPSSNMGPRIGAEMVMAYPSLQSNIVMLGGGYAPNFPLDSTHEQLYIIVFPEMELDVSVIRMENGVDLKAELPENHNWSRYQWEKSEDGERFAVVGEPKAVSSSQLSDLDPDLHLSTLFYRLALLEENGAMTHSQVVELSPILYPEPMVSPNPFREELFVEDEGEWEFSLHDYSGRTLVNGAGADKMALPVDGLAAGAYVLRIKSRGGTYMHRLVKVN